ncbi:MAG: GNAT family N-acetyltransferase [Bacteroidia bacterium]
MKLEPLQLDTWQAVANLTLAAGQERFMPPVVWCIAEAFFEKSAQLYGARVGEEWIGFVKIVPGEGGVQWIARLMVHAPYQGQGFGQAILKEVVVLARRSARLRQLRAAVHKENTPALQAFRKVGFQALPPVGGENEILHVLTLT